MMNHKFNFTKINLNSNVEPHFTYGVVMLKNYFWSAGLRTDAEEQRIIAVQEALEIIKASVSANTADINNSKAKWDIKHAADGLDKLADAIQSALKVK